MFPLNNKKHNFWPVKNFGHPFLGCMITPVAYLGRTVPLIKCYDKLIEAEKEGRLGMTVGTRVNNMFQKFNSNGLYDCVFAYF